MASASASGKPIVVIAGPTASGKSALAMAVAAAFDGVVVNADSMQVYQELRIVTARPSAADEARVPHHLYGVVPAAEICSVGRWLDLAMAAIADIWAANRLPVVCGGTGLYLKCLMEGLSEMPDVPAAVRARARAAMAARGARGLHRDLAVRDPETAARLNPADSQRVTRAWEIVEATGVSLSQWWRDHPPVTRLDARFAAFVLLPPRDGLYARCDRRLDQMLDSGGWAEIERLLAMNLDPALPAMKALGVPELAAAIQGSAARESAVQEAKRYTRNFAKRQCTWFRNQMPNAEILPAQYSESLSAKIFPNIRHFLLTP